MKRGGPIARKTPMRRTPMHRTARRDDGVEFLPHVKQEAAFRHHNHCGFPGCKRAIQTYHHILRRSQGGKGTVGNCLPLCHEDHRYIHDHPAESFENGWLRHPRPAGGASTGI